MQEVFSAYRLYVDGELRGSVGNVETGQEKIHDQVFSFDLKERTQIIVQTKNASRCYSGIYYPPMIGTASGIARTISARIAIYAIICSIAICIVLLTLPFRRGKHAVRHRGLFAVLTTCFTISITYPFMSSMGFSFTALFYFVEDITAALVPFFALLLTIDLTGQTSSKFAKNVALPFSVGLLLLHLAGVFLVKLSGFASYYGLIISISEAVIASFIVIVALRGLMKKYKQQTLDVSSPFNVIFINSVCDFAFVSNICNGAI